MKLANKNKDHFEEKQRLKELDINEAVSLAKTKIKKERENSFRVLLVWIFVALIIIPLIAGIAFSLNEGFAHYGNKAVCTITEADYMPYLTIEATKKSMATYIPLYAWASGCYLLIEIIISMILIREIFIKFHNNKALIEKKKSFFKHNKLFILNYITLLALIGYGSNLYMNSEKPRMAQQLEFLEKKAGSQIEFFRVCSSASKIVIGQTNSIKEKE